MPTWAEVQDYARSKYSLEQDDDDLFQLVWEYGSGRMQRIAISRFEAMGREWVDFASPVCRREDLDPEEALTRNFGFALGGLCLKDGHYLVRYSTQLATMDLDEFELPLRVVASTADRLEAELTDRDEF